MRGFAVCLVRLPEEIQACIGRDNGIGRGLALPDGAPSHFREIRLAGDLA